MREFSKLPDDEQIDLISNLYHCGESGDLAQVLILVSSGAPPQIALHGAIDGGQLNILRNLWDNDKALLEQSAALLPLMLFSWCENGQARILSLVRLFVDYGKLEDLKKQGDGFLAKGVEYGSAELVNFLLINGLEPTTALLTRAMELLAEKYSSSRLQTVVALIVAGATSSENIETFKKYKDLIVEQICLLGNSEVEAESCQCYEFLRRNFERRQNAAYVPFFKTISPRDLLFYENKKLYSLYWELSVKFSSSFSRG